MAPKRHSRIAAGLFKDRLKTARKQAGLTQDQLATKADIAVVTLSKLETGVNRPTFEVLVSLSCALNTSPNALLGWTDETDSTDAERRQLSMRLASAVDGLSDEWLEQLVSLAEIVKKSG